MKKIMLLSAAILFIGTIAAAQTKVAAHTFKVEEQSFQRNGMKIYGKLFLPDSASPVPLVILSHGFGGNHGGVKGYAAAFAEQGIAAYIFDFIGGGNHIKSDGKMTEMSVLTEAEDLTVILDNLKADSRFKPEQIFLLGESQGGFVSTYIAALRPADVAGLVLLYPAFVLHDYIRRRTPDPERIPDTMKLLGKTVGRIYNKDVLSFDIYTLIPRYSGKTLIIHGTADSLVPLSYSERAIKTFPDAKLIKLDGAKHVFYGDMMQKAAEDAVKFVQSIIDEKRSFNCNVFRFASRCEIGKSMESSSRINGLHIYCGVPSGFISSIGRSRIIILYVPSSSPRIRSASVSFKSLCIVLLIKSFDTIGVNFHIGAGAIEPKEKLRNLRSASRTA